MDVDLTFFADVGVDVDNISYVINQVIVENIVIVGNIIFVAVHWCVSNILHKYQKYLLTEK